MSNGSVSWNMCKCLERLHAATAIGAMLADCSRWTVQSVRKQLLVFGIERSRSSVYKMTTGHKDAAAAGRREDAAVGDLSCKSWFCEVDGVP